MGITVRYLNGDMTGIVSIAIIARAALSVLINTALRVMFSERGEKREENELTLDGYPQKPRYRGR